METSPIVAVARSWVGTRYHHQGRRKRTSLDRGGVDCLGLLIGIAGELGLEDRHGQPLSRQDRADYSRQPDGLRLQATLEECLWHCDPGSPPQPGDIALFRFERQAQHLAILAAAEYDGTLCSTIIHAYAPSRAVVEHRYDAAWEERLIARYRVTP